MADTHAEDLEARLEAIELRLNQIDLVVTYLCGRAYSPSDRRIRTAVAAIRERAGKLGGRVESPRPASEPPSAVATPAKADRARELAEEVMAAAAEARKVRAQVDELKARKAREEEVSEAESAAQAAEQRARELAEAAKAELADG